MMSSGPRSAASRSACAIACDDSSAGQDALQPGEVLEAVERGAVVDPGVLGAAQIAQPRVLGADRGVIEAR